MSSVRQPVRAFRALWLTGLAALGAIPALPARAQSALERHEQELTAIARRVSLSTVQVQGRYEGGAGQRRRASREMNLSGVVLSADGAILTLGDRWQQMREIRIRLPDGEVVSGRFHAHDREMNLTVLYADAKHLTPAAWGDSDRLELGSLLVVAGYPFGVGQTFGQGCVTGLRRPLRAGGTMPFNALQTNAPINPGDAGGFVGNVRGELVGVVLSTFRRLPERDEIRRWLTESPQTPPLPVPASPSTSQPPDKAPPPDLSPEKMLESMLNELLGNAFNEKGPSQAEKPSEPPRNFRDLWSEWVDQAEQARLARESDAQIDLMSAQGINFVLPGNLARRVAKDLVEFGAVRRGRLGLGLVAHEGDLGNSSVVVADIEPQGPAASAGFQPGDVITAVNGIPVRGMADIYEEVALAEVGAVLNMTVRRGQDSERTALTLSTPLAFPDLKKKRLGGEKPE